MAITTEIREALKAVEDPELGFSIVELGLVYDIACDAQGVATITMTLTSPACPRYADIVGAVTQAARSVAGVSEVTVEVTFDPPWSLKQASDDVQDELVLRGVPRVW